MSKHAILSASASGRWLNCTAAPRYEEQFPDSTSAYAANGSIVHEICELKALKKFTTSVKPSTYKTQLNKLKKKEKDFVESHNKQNPDRKLTIDGDHCSDSYVDYLTETAMGYNSTPLVNVEVKVDFSEYVPNGFGTCDCVMIGGDTLNIIDYKHGVGVTVHADGNSQMRLYALGALKKYESFYGGMIKQVRMSVFQPRAMNEADRITTETLALEDLMAWGESIRPIAQKAFAGFGEFVPGEHCRFCRGKAQCRARANANTALEDFKDLMLPTSENLMLIDNAGVGISDAAILTHAEIGGLLVRGQSLVQWYKDLEEFALAALLRGEDIAGWKVVAGRSNRTFSDVDAAIAAVIASGYDEALVYERKPKTLTQLETLMGKQPFEDTIGRFIYKPPGKPTLAPLSDKREPYNSAASDFAEAKGRGESLPFN